MKRNTLILVFSLLFFTSGFSIEPVSDFDKSNAEKVSLSLDSVLDYGLSFLRTPYRFGSSGPKTFDCSGFTSYVYRHFGYDLAHRALVQANNSTYISKQNLQKGDLVFFTSRSSRGAVGHVGIVLQKKENGEFDFIHASVKEGVTVSSSEQPYYAARFLRGGRIVEGVYPVNFEDLNYKKSTEKQIENSENSAITYQYYIVKKGDNLSQIATQHDVTVTALKQLNGLKNNKIKKGMKLKISENVPDFIVEDKKITEEIENLPQPEFESKNIASVNTVTLNHKVEQGETLYSIAKAHNTTIEKIKELNNLNSDNLNLGQILVFDIAENKTENEKLSSNLAVNKTVKAGTTEDVIEKLRALAERKRIKPTKETVTAQTESTIEKVVVTPPQKHKVKKGETLSKIAADNKIGINDLKKINHLLSAKIKPGQVLIVKEGTKSVKKVSVNSTLTNETPAKEVAVQKQIEPKQTQLEIPKTEENPVTEDKPQKHKVAKGETLYEIAKANNLTVSELKQINNLTSDNVQLGQVLILNKQEKTATVKSISSEKKSKEKSGITTHTVKKGETLYSIRKKYGCKLDQLKKWNNLSDGQIKIGQKLIVNQ